MTHALPDFPDLPDLTRGLPTIPDPCDGCGHYFCECGMSYGQQLRARLSRFPCPWCGASRSAIYCLPNGRSLWFCQCRGGSRVIPLGEAR